MPLPQDDSVNVNGGDIKVLHSMTGDHDQPSTSSGSHSLTDDVFESSQQQEEEPVRAGFRFDLISSTKVHSRPVLTCFTTIIAEQPSLTQYA